MMPTPNSSQMSETEDNGIREKSLAYWSGRAPEYSEFHEDELASPRGQRFAAILTSLDAAVPGAHVLNLGCGSGLLSVVLASAGCDVTGVDFSEAMLQQARINADAHGVHTTLVHADVQKLPFNDNTFDLIVTRNVTWVLENVDTVYAEVVRVLKPKGTFVNFDANYGQAFRAAEARGEEPVHPTQTSEQLHTRNDIVRELPITLANRPVWDIQTLWDLGVTSVSCRRDFEALLDGIVPPATDNSISTESSTIIDRLDTPYSKVSAKTRATMFMLQAVK